MERLLPTGHAGDGAGGSCVGAALERGIVTACKLHSVCEDIGGTRSMEALILTDCFAIAVW